MIGIDIVEIDRVRKKVNNNRFDKIFTDKELAYALSKNNYTQTLSGIFAAKEAIVKAYNLSLAYIISKRIEIIYKNSKPFGLIDGKLIDGEISISHDKDYAISICQANPNIHNNIVVDQDMKKLVIKRSKESHKGTYGKIAILGGSEGMAGSCYLSSKAALRTGAGLVYLLVPQSISNILQIKCTEQIIKTIETYNLMYNDSIYKQILSYLDDKDVLAIGPGMGSDKSLNLLIGKLLKDFPGKFIIDADGLNALSTDKSVLAVKKDIILTPHIKEFSRLTGMSIKEINSDRIGIAKSFAKKYKVILVLKSENTIVTDGKNIYINKIGNPGMATAGSGDVLTGIIAALLHMMPSYLAAKLGVYLHSLSGDLASIELSEQAMIASDIIENLPKALGLMR